MKHPSDYYIRYLLAASWNEPDQPLTLEAVNQTLEDMGLLPMKDRQWDYLLATFQAPPDFLFNNTNHAPTVAFMKRERIYTIWVSDQDMSRILVEIMGGHGNRIYQHDLHILLMGNIPFSVIAEKLNRKYFIAQSLTERMIDLYQHYFWRRENLTKVQWAKFLDGDPNYDDYVAPLMCGEQQALFRAGMNPKYDYKQSLRDAHRQGSFRLQYLAYKPDDKRTADIYGKLTREIRALHVLLNEGGGFDEQLKEARHWAMEHSPEKIPALTDVVGENGSYSGDGTDEKAAGAAQQEKGDQDGGNEDA